MALPTTWGKRVQDGALGWRRAGGPLILLAMLGAGVVLLPPAYLLLRALQGVPESLSAVWQPRTLVVLGRSLGLAVTVTAFSAVLGVLVAWLTVRTDLPYRRVWAILAALPLVIPSYVGAYLMVASLGPRGMLQHWLEPLLGVQRLPDIYGFPGSALVLTLLSYPYVLLAVRAALQRIDPTLEEASRGLGLGPLATFRRVTLPLLRPSLAAGCLLVALYALRDFGAVSIMRFNTFTRSIYVQYQSSFDRIGASTLALVLVVLTLGILVLEARARGRARYSTPSAKSTSPPPLVRLGRWTWPALALCALLVLLALVLPAGVLAFWLARGIRAGEPLLSLWEPTGNSLTGSLAAAGASLLVGLPIAILSARHPGRLGERLEQITYAGYALPGIVVALALVFFSVRYLRPWYQSLPVLVLGYVALFLPQAVGVLRASLMQIHPSLEEAARSLGRSPIKVFAGVTFPLLRPGLLSSAALVFLTAMKELPVTLILAPLGFKTLATGVWSAVSEAYFAQAAAPALLIILASSIPMAYFVLRQQKASP